LSFGLVTVPIKLTSAARREAISFNMLHAADNSRMKQVLMCQLEDKAVDRSEIVKGYEYEKDHYVVITDAELEEIQPKSAKTVEILEFVKAKEINPVYLDSSYYVAPGVGAGERAYALLFKALRDSGHVGVAKIAMHGQEHIVILRPGEHGLVLHTVYYADEIRQVEEFRTDCSEIEEMELRMAVRLIKSMRAAFELDKYKDSYRENVQRLIAAKIEGNTLATSAQPTRLAPVIDIMDALKQSLAKKNTSATAVAHSASHGVGDGSEFPEKPHTNSHTDAGSDAAGLQASSTQTGAQEQQQRAMGDPLLKHGGRGSRPPRASRPAVDTPNRSQSGGKNQA
jgi:DNA end-binding protein Ku